MRFKVKLTSKHLKITSSNTEFFEGRNALTLVTIHNSHANSKLLRRESTDYYICYLKMLSSFMEEV